MRCSNCNYEKQKTTTYQYGDNERESITTITCFHCGETLDGPRYNDEGMVDYKFVKYSVMVIITFVVISYIPTLIVAEHFSEHLVWFLWVTAAIMHSVRYVLVKKIMEKGE